MNSQGLVFQVAGGIRGYRDGRGGEAQFSGIDGVAWATDGSLYVTDELEIFSNLRFVSICRTLIQSLNQVQGFLHWQPEGLSFQHLPTEHPER